MFQDIAPHTLAIAFAPRAPAPDDYLLTADTAGRLLMAERNGTPTPTLATCEELTSAFPGMADGARFLFTIDERAVFLARTAPGESRVTAGDGFAYHELFDLRDLGPTHLAFAVATAAHLAQWYASNRYCGRCASPMEDRPDERSLSCPVCKLSVYPHISPVVIVGIIDGDRLLLTRYAHAPYRRYALVAGFVEIGETFEDAIRREVMEEVGLKVRNIRYHASQPWAFSSSLLAGFFAEVDGDPTPHADQQELSEALWFARDELPHDDTTFSLTWALIEAFREGRSGEASEPTPCVDDHPFQA